MFFPVSHVQCEVGIVMLKADCVSHWPLVTKNYYSHFLSNNHQEQKFPYV